MISLRFLYYFITEGGTGHIQSLILAAVMFILGFQIIVMGFVADLIANNRSLIEDALYRIKKVEITQKDSK